MIQFVSTCTDRKTVSPAIHARHLTAATPKGRADEWVTAITQLPGERSARDIYAGEMARVAVAAAGRDNLRHLICSAGYGLIEASTRIAGYSATFNSPHADEVTGAPKQATARRDWWKALRGSLSVGAPSLAALGREGPILLAASPTYLDAMYDEIAAGIASGARVIVVTSRRTRGQLEDVLVPVTGRMSGVLGGSMMSINLRVAARIMDELPEGRLSVENAREVVERLTADAPVAKKFDRRPLSDDEVVDFILRQLVEDRSSSHSRLLRLLRSSGFACEQARFRSLYSLASSSLPSDQ